MLRKFSRHRTMHRPRFFFTGILIIAVLTLAACGNKGALRLPEPPKSEAAPAAPAPANTTPTAPAGTTP